MEGPAADAEADAVEGPACVVADRPRLRHVPIPLAAHPHPVPSPCQPRRGGAPVKEGGPGVGVAANEAGGGEAAPGQGGGARDVGGEAELGEEPPGRLHDHRAAPALLQSQSSRRWADRG